MCKPIATLHLPNNLTDAELLNAVRTALSFAQGNTAQIVLSIEPERVGGFQIALHQETAERPRQWQYDPTKTQPMPA